MGGIPKLKNCKLILSCKKDCRENCEIQGGDIFLSGSEVEIEYGPRKYYNDTYEGNKIIDSFFVAFDVASNYNNDSILPGHDKAYLVI